jgi:pts-lac: PTS system, lactose/cellobiose family IIB component
MKKILLVCNAGMSTSMLVLKMEKAAQDKGIEMEVKALPVTDAEKELNDWDVIMLGPQVRHIGKEIKRINIYTN